MAQTISVPQPVGADLAFEHEWLDVYIVAREFQSLVPQLVPRRGFASLRDQLDRASSSVLLNVAEGAGRFARAEKAHFYLIARGSAMESAAGRRGIDARLGPVDRLGGTSAPPSSSSPSLGSISRGAPRLKETGQRASPDCAACASRWP
jgi:hypothetical protein